MDQNLKDKSLSTIEQEASTSENPFLSFLTKKAEKLTIGVHLVSGFIDKEEPLYKKLRAKSVEILSDIISYKTNQNAKLYAGIETSLSEILTILLVSFRTGVVSEMNCTILAQEYALLLSMLKDKRGMLTERVSGIEFPERFFDVEKGGLTIKGVVSKSQKFTKRKSTGETSAPRRGIFRGGMERERSSRREAILNVFKDKERVTVGDLTTFIKGYSGKTLQRELMVMVAEGILKREGKRRWSTYVLSGNTTTEIIPRGTPTV